MLTSGLSQMHLLLMYVIPLKGSSFPAPLHDFGFLLLKLDI